MLTKETTEQLASILSHLQYVPSMHESVLFPFDVEELVKFQIRCHLNDSGRLVYSLVDSKNCPDSEKNFKEKYKELYGFDVKSTPAIEDKQIYPTSGSDSIHDIAPGTICRLISYEIKWNPEEDICVATFVMKLREQIEQWENHFRKMAENLNNLKQITEQTYEKLFQN